MTNVFEYEMNKYLEVNMDKFLTTDKDKFIEAIVKSDVSMAEVGRLKLKSPKFAKVLSVCSGFLGIDRFYAGNYVLGVLKLVTGGFWLIGWIIDIGWIETSVKIANQDKLVSLLTGQKVKTKFDFGKVSSNLNSSEGRNALKGLWKSTKKIIDTMDI